jgi:hypothetical protein
MSDSIAPSGPQLLQDLRPHLDPLAVAETALADHAAVIRELAKRGIGDTIEIGRRLTEAKKLVGHGNWLIWLAREFGWSDETARRFMSVYEMSKFHKLWNLNLPVSALFVIAQSSTPEKARNEILRRAGSGERFTFEQIKKIIAGHKAPVRKAQPSPTTKMSENQPPPTTLVELIKCIDGAPEEVQNALLARLGGERILKVPELRLFFRDRVDRECARLAAAKGNVEPTIASKVVRSFKSVLSLVKAGDKHSAEVISKLHAVNRMLASKGHDLHDIGFVVAKPQIVERAA